jgi:hypothetical protein
MLEKLMLAGSITLLLSLLFGFNTSAATGELESFFHNSSSLQAENKPREFIISLKKR